MVLKLGLLLFLIFVQSIFSAEAPPAKPDLTGVVTGAENQPLTNASIFIYTAAPRKGVGYL